VSFPTDDEDADMQGSLHDSARDGAREALSSEAAEWFIRLRDDRLSERYRERNVRWLKESPAHIAELLRIQQVYKVLRAAKLENRPPGPPGEAEPHSNVIELMPRALPMPPAPTTPRPSQSRIQIDTWKVAASVACLAVSLLLGYIVKVAWLDRTLETELGEWRIATLSDGSVVRVGPGSKLRISFGDDHRTVRLIRGEAMFDVAKDHSRPFFVKSEMVGVLAVGTEFRVSRRGGEDVVAVTEGTVALYRDDRDAVRGDEVRGSVAQPVTQPVIKLAEATGGVALTAGEQVSISKANQSRPVAKQKVNVDYERAWVDGWLMYEDKTVAEVANEFNRRNRVKIEIVDEAIAERRLALFRGSATDPESFVAALAAYADVTIVRNDPDVLRVEASPQGHDDGAEADVAAPPANDPI
jgi:transmembrane sensor